ncbi:unannotated protein [freshwater metagenome]|uniref:Unannotated protein n=1 Tax=freshwater metagenome TaxID=449393 RepID=A0A6J6W590_9ZZZZ
MWPHARITASSLEVIPTDEQHVDVIEHADMALVPAVGAVEEFVRDLFTGTFRGFIKKCFGLPQDFFRNWITVSQFNGDIPGGVVAGKRSLPRSTNGGQ